MEEEAMLQKGMYNKDSKEEHAVLKKKKKRVPGYCKHSASVFNSWLVEI